MDDLELVIHQWGKQSRNKAQSCMQMTLTHRIQGRVIHVWAYDSQDKGWAHACLGPWLIGYRVTSGILVSMIDRTQIHVCLSLWWQGIVWAHFALWQCGGIAFNSISMLDAICLSVSRVQCSAVQHLLLLDLRLEFCENWQAKYPSDTFPSMLFWTCSFTYLNSR